MPTLEHNLCIRQLYSAGVDVLGPSSLYSQFTYEWQCGPSLAAISLPRGTDCRGCGPADPAFTTLVVCQTIFHSLPFCHILSHNVPSSLCVQGRNSPITITDFKWC